MLHRVSSSDVQELNRVLELIQKQGNSAPTSSNAQNSSSPSGGSSILGSTAPGTPGPPGKAGVDGINGSTASLIVGADLIPEILLDANHNVLTDENGYALIGIHVSSSILTGAGVSSIEVLSGT